MLLSSIKNCKQLKGLNLNGNGNIGKEGPTEIANFISEHNIALTSLRLWPDTKRVLPLIQAMSNSSYYVTLSELILHYVESTDILSISDFVSECTSISNFAIY
jgi:hypothetical protein